jgi:hypothetical protein
LWKAINEKTDTLDHIRLFCPSYSHATFISSDNSFRQMPYFPYLTASHFPPANKLAGIQWGFSMSSVAYQLALETSLHALDQLCQKRVYYNQLFKVSLKVNS